MTRAPISMRLRGGALWWRLWPSSWASVVRGNRRGFTLIEVLIAMAVLTIALVAIAGMFPAGYRQVTDAGRMTLAVTAARQMLEDLRNVPFDSLDNLNGFNSENSATQPADDPERGVVRRWRYAVAGDGDGFNLTPVELANWQSLSPLGGGRVTVQVQAVGGSPTLRQVTVTLSMDALVQTVQLSTIIVRM
jgi:prepilin-type N-terminal cleavage/methylation domain-containing protein